MRVLFVTPRLPYLPCHDAARLAASHLVDHLAGRHAVAVVAATGSGDTPAQRGWLASRAALVETVPAGRWRRALSGRLADALATLHRMTRRVAARFAPDVIHLESALLAPLARGAAAPTVLACHESATLRARVWGAAVYVSPLEAGFGRKARLLEPMALGTPVVASPPTLAGMPDVLPGHHLLTADGDEQV